MARWARAQPQQRFAPGQPAQAQLREGVGSGGESLPPRPQGRWPPERVAPGQLLAQPDRQGLQPGAVAIGPELEILHHLGFKCSPGGIVQQLFGLQTAANTRAALGHVFAQV